MYLYKNVFKVSILQLHVMLGFILLHKAYFLFLFSAKSNGRFLTRKWYVRLSLELYTDSDNSNVHTQRLVHIWIF